MLKEPKFLSEFVKNVEFRRLERARILEDKEFSRLYPRSEKLGNGGGVINAFAVDGDLEHVRIEPVSNDSDDAVYTEMMLLSRLREKKYHVSQRGYGIRDRESGKPCSLEDESIPLSERTRLLFYLKSTISETHVVGGNVLDVKPDSILWDDDGKMAKVDFNAAVLLPEWDAIESAWGIRNNIAARENSGSAEMKSVESHGLDHRLLRNLRGHLSREIEIANHPEEKMLRAADLLTHDSVTSLLGPELTKKMKMRSRPELIDVPMILNHEVVKKNDQLLEDDRKLVLEIIEIASLRGVFPREIESVQPEEFSVTRNDVKIFFQILGLDDLLNNDPLVVLRTQGTRHDNIEIARHLYNNLLSTFDGNEVLPVNNLNNFVKKLDSVFVTYIESYCKGLIFDWNKFADICKDNPNLLTRKPDFVSNLTSIIAMMEKALATGDFNSVRMHDFQIMRLNS